MVKDNLFYEGEKTTMKDVFDVFITAMFKLTFGLIVLFVAAVFRLISKLVFGK